MARFLERSRFLKRTTWIPTKARATQPKSRHDVAFIWLLALLAAQFFATSPAIAVDKWYVEFSGDGFDESVVRRAVALELREVEIPGDPRRPDDTSEKVSLRILVVRDQEALVVSLWDRGEYAGRRRLSASAHPRILARRVGLAVGELGRQLSARRSRLVQRLQREVFLAEEQALEEKRAEELQNLGLLADGQTLWIPRGAYLLGPSLGVELNDQFPVRFSFGLSWMTGAIPRLSESTLGKTSPSWSMFDLWLNADYVFMPTERNWLSTGVVVAQSAVHVGGASEVDEIAFQRDTYSARLGARIGYNHAFASKIRVRTAVSAGSLLRSIPIRRGDDRLDMGGAFVGWQLGITLAR